MAESGKPPRVIPYAVFCERVHGFRHRNLGAYKTVVHQCPEAWIEPVCCDRYQPRSLYKKAYVPYFLWHRYGELIFWLYFAAFVVSRLGQASALVLSPQAPCVDSIRSLPVYSSRERTCRQ